MLSEFLDNLLAKASHSAFLEKGKQKINHAVYLPLPNGTYQSVPLKADDRDHACRSVESFLAACKEWGHEGIVWHDHNEVVLVCDDESRRDRVRMPLLPSRQWLVLEDLPMSFSPATARQFFLRQMRSEIPSGLSQFSFARTSTQRADADSLGRSVEAEVSSPYDIPDGKTVSVPIYQTDGMKGPEEIRLAIDVDFSDECVKIYPLPGELQTAIDRRQAALHDMLLETGLPVFYGTP